MTMDAVTQYLLSYLPNMLAAIVIFIIGVSIALFLKKLSMKWIKNRANITIQSFVIKFVYIITLILFGIIALSKLGVPTASLITLLGAAGLAIGLALKDFLSNVAAGFVIIFVRPFKIGDYIDIAGDTGVVADVNLFVIQITTLNNEVIFIPNNTVVTERVINFSRFPNRRLDLTVGISYDSNIDTAKSVINQILTDDDMFLKEPEPTIAVKNLADSAVELTVRVHVDRKNYLLGKYKLFEMIKKRFDEEKITIPFPQRDVHLKYKDKNQPL